MFLMLHVPSIFAAGIQFDWTITLGNLVGTASIVFGIWSAAYRTYSHFDRRMQGFEDAISRHAATIKDHDLKLDKQDNLLRDIMKDLQRLMGRMEQRVQDRRESA